jgi:hypothetical protein
VPKSDLFEDETGVSGFLMWLAPNGTFYEAVYPAGTVLGELGRTIGETYLKSPEGYYLWDLSYGEGEE